MGPIVINNTIVCNLCIKLHNFELVNNTCVCKSGYILNKTTEICDQICGDGVNYRYQCDDGNN